jgi:histidine phosphotransferase ChpT
VPYSAQLDPLHLAALVSSRLCHDLISPIGAIGNGVELMMMDQAGTSGQEMALILESTCAANARIRFFRVAFGLCGPDQRINRSEIATIIDDLTTGGRLKIVWDSPMELARRDVKLALLGLLCIESALPQGGDVTVTLSDTGWQLAATSRRIRIDPILWDAVSNVNLYREITPSQVHFPMMTLEAARQHRRIIATLSETDIKMTF